MYRGICFVFSQSATANHVCFATKRKKFERNILHSIKELV